MDSPSPRSSKPAILSDAPDPRDDPGLLRTWAGYRQALSTMTIEELMKLADNQAARLEQENREAMNRLLSTPLSESLSALDRLQVRSPRTAPQPSQADRGVQASQRSPALPQPSALDRLASSKYMAPRLAAKLVASEARRARRDRDG